MSGPTRLLTRLARRPALVLTIAALAAIGAGALAARLRLRASLVELLPTRDPAVVDLERTRARAGDMNLLLVGIRSPDRAANLRYAAALTAHLRSLPRSVCDVAAYNVRDLRAFFREHRWLYASEADLTEARDRLRAELTRHKNPLYVDLSDEGGASAALGSDDLARAARTREDDLDRKFPGGDFVRGDYAWVAALPPGGMLADDAGEALLAAVRAYVAAHPPASFHPAMQVMPAGPVVSALRNREAIERDVAAVTLACLVVISLAICFYFRSLRALLLVVAPALLGTAVAFAAAALAFGYLNSSTAFLGSIILGNGINHAIILLSRSRESRDIEEAIEGSWRGTLAAALAAAVAYASLTLTSFRGFSQFGLMGAVGSLACWGATFLVGPALMAVVDRRRARRAPPRRLALFGWLARRRPRTVLVAAAVLTALSAASLVARRFLHDPFEYDFRKLSTELDREPTYKQFDQNLDALFGRWHTPTVLLADRLEDVEDMRRAIRARDDQRRPYIGQIVTVYDLLPGPPEVQARKLALLAEIRRLGHDPAVELLEDHDRRTLRENLPPADLRPLAPGDLPPLARRPFTETDGTVGRPLLVYHAEKNVSMWNGRDLLGIAGVLERLDLPDGRVVRSSGAPMIFGAMLRSILRDGPRATLLSLAGVLLVVALVVRPVRAALLAALAMLLGVTWMVGAAAAAGVRITFLNFIALPITFGIGVEYAVNMVARLRREPDPAAAVQSTGGAVALCSFTTIVGYGSLLAAHSQALRGFGAMAILGEIGCLLAALLVLPALAPCVRRLRD